MLLLGMLTPPLLSAMRDSFSSDELNDEIMTLDVDHPDQEPISNLETNSNSDGDAAEADDAAIHSVEEGKTAEDGTEGGGRQVVILLDVDGVINIDVWVEKQPIGEVQVLTEDQRLQMNKDGHLEWVHYGGKEDIDGLMADDKDLTEQEAIDFLKEIDESQRTDAKYHFAVQSRTVPDDDGRKYSDLLASDMVPNHDLVVRLAHIIKSAGPDVQVVLSSTWRKTPEKAANLEKVIEAALDNGKQFKFAAFTGQDVFGPSGRFEEVGDWLAEYCKKSGTRGGRDRSKKLSVVMLDDIHANGWEELKHYSLNKIELKDQKAAEAYLMTHVPDDQKASVSVTFVHTFESFNHAELGRVRVGRGLTGSKYKQALNAVNPDAKDAAAANTLPSSSIGSGSSGRKSTDSGLGSTEGAESPDLRSSSTPVKVKTPPVDVKSTGSTDSVPGSEAAPQKKEVSTSSDAQTVMLGPEGRKKAATVGATVYSQKQVKTNDDRTMDPVESGTVAAVREGQFDVDYKVRAPGGAGRKAKYETLKATVLEKDYANWRVLQAAPTAPSKLTRSSSQKTGSDGNTPPVKSYVRSLSEGTDGMEKIMVKGVPVTVGVSRVYVNKYKGQEYPETGIRVKVMSVITDPVVGKVLLVGSVRERIPPPYDAVIKVDE
jgi:hypothetical protein